MVETHAFSNLDFILNGMALLYSDETLLSDLLYGSGNAVGDVDITVGRDSGDLGNFSGGGDSFGVGAEEFEEAVGSGLGTSAKIHGVATSSKVLHILGVGCTGENNGCCYPVTVTLFAFWATS